MKRRSALKTGILSSAAFALSGGINKISAQEQGQLQNASFLKGNINHSVCRWCYGNIPLEEFAETCKTLGIKSIELLKPNEWESVYSQGISCAVASDDFASITDGWNEVKNHGQLQENYKGLIRKAADQGIPNVIVFSGNRRGMPDYIGLENCAVGLQPIIEEAKQAGVTIIMELLNSRVDHWDYMCDRTEWGMALTNKIGSDHFKLLYDIYHMQIMEGDIIATIKRANSHIAHYHTGGVPGRNEINLKQELNYPAIMKVILDSGYHGFVAQEFIPTYDDKIAALKEGITICDV